MSKTILDNRQHIWNLRGTYSLNQAQEAALNILVVVSQQLVNILVEVLMNSYDHPLRIHFEKEEESEDRFSSEDDRLVL